MKSYEEIASEVLEAARERRQQIGKRRRITLISGIAAVCVVGIGLAIWVGKPNKRVETVAQPVASVQTMTTTVTEAEIVPETTEAFTMPTRAKETRSTKTTTTTVPKYTRGAYENNDYNEENNTPVGTDVPEPTMTAPPAPFTPSTTAPAEGSTPHTEAHVEPSEHGQQTDAPAVHTEAPKPDPEPVVTAAPTPPPLPMPEDDIVE
ncbi:MAG: hypothetical protein K5695_01100 [Oscillospiraceae bacterium]|nr:hypothetical protein [Oscillospiraceae bacterium]